MKDIIVIVIPSCISYNREKQYMEEAKRAYCNGTLTNHMEIVEETEEVALCRTTL